MNRSNLGGLGGTLALREQSQRRVVLCAIASLLVLSTSPVFAHHLALGAQLLLAGKEHLGAFCLTSLHLLLAPVHYGFHVIFGLGLSYAMWDRWSAWRLAIQAIAPLEAFVPEPEDPFARAAEAAGVDRRRIRLVRGLPCPAMTTGMIHPLIYVASDLPAALTPDELVSVLAHEGAHLKRRDPLRLFVLRFLACTLFWIPALRRLAEDVADEAEILADDRAARGRPLVLATALLILAHRSCGGRVAGDTAPFVDSQCPGLLDRRIRRLAGEPVTARSHLTRRSLLGAMVALSLVWASGLVMEHPLPQNASLGSVTHCQHQSESPLHHLFCLGEPFARLARECPHVTNHVSLHLHA